MGDPRHHLHQQGGRRDAHAGWPSWSARRPRRCGSRPSTRPACASCAPTPTGSGYRSAFTVYDDTDSRRLIEMITAELGFDQKRLPAAGRAGRDQPGQVRAGRLRDLPRGGPQRARPVPQAHRRRLRAVPAAPAGGQRLRLRRPADGDGQPAPGLRRRARGLPGALPPHPGRRVPGHQPRPERDRQAARRGARQRLRGGRLRPVGLPLARRRHPQHLGVRAGLPQRRRRSCWSRTSAPPRRSSMRPTPSSPTTSAASPRSSSPSATPAARSSATAPRTSATRRRGSRARSCGCTRPRGSRGATSPSSTAPTRRACRSRRP